jgi:hypothetical protein
MVSGNTIPASRRPDTSQQETDADIFERIEQET